MTKHFNLSKSTTKTVNAPIDSRTGVGVNIKKEGANQPTDVKAEDRWPFEVYVQNDSDDTPFVYFSRQDENKSSIYSASLATGSGM